MRQRHACSMSHEQHDVRFACCVIMMIGDDADADHEDDDDGDDDHDDDDDGDDVMLRST